MSFSILQRSNNQPVSLVNQLSTVSTQSPQIWNAINSSSAIPSAAKIAAQPSYQVKSTSGQMGTVTGTVTTLASGSSSAYHDWLTGSGSLLNTLQSANAGAGKILNVSSFRSPAGDTFGNNLFGFSTVASTSGTSPFHGNGTSTNYDPTNRFLEGQSYNTTAHFTTNLNPGNNAELAALGITNGTGGVKFTGTGTGTNSVGTLNLYISNASLNAANGIYGSNPYYVVEWKSFDGENQTGTTYYVQQQNSNNIVDRIVGDLTAGITFGWATADSETITAHAASTGTEALLDGTIFSSTYSGTGTASGGKKINELSPGEYYYLLSVLGIVGEGNDTSGENIADWSGSQINSSDLFYDNYGDVLVSYTDAYSYPYSDRLQGYSPDVFPLPATGSAADAANMYIYITLNDGGYTYTVPEPSTYGLLFFGVVAVFCFHRRNQRDKNRVQ